MMRFSHFLKTLYSHCTRLAWDVLLLIVAIHALVSYAVMRVF